MFKVVEAGRKSVSSVANVHDFVLKFDWMLMARLAYCLTLYHETSSD